LKFLWCLEVGIWSFKSRIFTAGELVKHGYPATPDPEAIYAVFDVEPDSFYHGWKWDYANLPGKKPAFASAEPYAVSLVQVLAVHRL